MSHPKTRLPLRAAAILTLSAAAPAAPAAPTPGAAPMPTTTAPVSHNEQGNLRIAPDKVLAGLPLPPAPSPCPADCDGNGAITSADISAFIARWMQSIGAGTLAADFNASGAVDSADISAFLMAWSAAAATGC